MCSSRLTVPDADGVDALAGQGLVPRLFYGIAGEDCHQHRGHRVSRRHRHDADDGDAKLAVREDSQIQHAQGHLGEARRDLV